MVPRYAAVIAAALLLSTTFPVMTHPAQAFTPTNEMQDLSPEHWAYQAVQALVEKYLVMEGYPDKTFHGNRNLTRYEFAAALYKVMTRMEEMIALTGPNRGNAAVNVDRADLETVAALQKEFKEELASFRGRLNRMEESLRLLEKIKIGGGIEVRYRDRMAVTDSTLSSSPLFNSNPDKDEVNSPGRQFISKKDRFPFRVRTNLTLDANITPMVSYAGRFIADEGGFLANAAGQQSVFIGGHFGAEGFLGAPVYVDKSMVSTAIPLGEAQGTPTLNVRFGLYNFGDVINPGTHLKNHFSGETWVGRGYGLVGWGGDEIGTSNQGARDTNKPYINSVSRFWVGDINASRVDPNSKRYNQTAAPGVSLDLHWGAMTLFFGANNGSFYTSRLLATQGNLGGIGPVGRGLSFGNLMNADALIGNMDRLSSVRSNVLDLPADLNDGYGVLGVDLDLGKPIGNDAFPVRLALYGMDYWNDAAFALSGTRKEISLVVDMGTNNLGGTIQANSSFVGYDMFSAALFANNVGGSGIDFGLGAKAALRGLFNFGGKGVAAANAGAYVSLPDFGGTIPKVLFALRQSFGDTLGSETGYQFLKDSGITLSVPFKQIAGTNLDVILEYNALMEGGFFAGRFMAHDLALYSRYRF